MGDQTTPDRPSSYFQISTSIYLNQKKKKREIRVKSTKLKYKNKGLKSQFTHTSSAVEQDDSIVKMTILLIWQQGSLVKPKCFV